MYIHNVYICIVCVYLYRYFDDIGVLGAVGFEIRNPSMTSRISFDTILYNTKLGTEEPNIFTHIENYMLIPLILFTFTLFYSEDILCPDVFPVFLDDFMISSKTIHPWVVLVGRVRYRRIGLQSKVLTVPL